MGQDIVVGTYIITSPFLVLLSGAEGMEEDTLITHGWCQHYLIPPPLVIVIPTVTFLQLFLEMFHSSYETTYKIFPSFGSHHFKIVNSMDEVLNQ